ncbi:hypothetical protein [Sphingobium sp. KCTC 72723]|uniref:hypothetical protein n=1 Tax=Sphingobium sp. KCTC 72723 TaxID=2733867 RepID=UPI00165D7FEA|nr:hypothetical protein [Sphingobium sp. KCTC 72723]
MGRIVDIAIHDGRRLSALRGFLIVLRRGPAAMGFADHWPNGPKPASTPQGKIKDRMADFRHFVDDFGIPHRRGKWCQKSFRPGDLSD